MRTDHAKKLEARPRERDEYLDADEAAARRPQTEPAARSRRRGGLLAGAAVVAALAAIYATRTVIFYLHHVETDDAQLDGHVYPVLPKIAGYVTEVDVHDNQAVKAGTVVVRIDERDLRARLQQAEAALESARAAVAVARANLTVTESHRGKAASDIRRYAALREKSEVSQQEFEAAKAAADATQAQVLAAARQVTAAEADVAQKRAALDAAELDLSYATLVAPSSGRVTKKSVEVGQYVQAGQPLFAVVQDEGIWAVANFKETQLHGIRPGARAEVVVDAYPATVFHGRVDSIAAATGARFALLPPDNATGNFVKVVQRVPVKILLDEPRDPGHPLRVGMNVTATIDRD